MTPSPDWFDRVSRATASTIESAVAMLGLRPRGEGVFAPGLSLRTPPGAPFCGVAVPVVMSTDEGGPRVENLAWWNHLHHIRGPKVVAALDTSAKRGAGVVCGRLSARMWQACGCRGLVTDGFVRDVPKIAPTGFGVVSAGVTIAHGAPHVVRFGEAVAMQGVTVRPGDPLFADSEGVLTIPADAARWLGEAILEVERRIAPVLAYCDSPGFDPVGLARAVERHMPPLKNWRPKP